MNAEPSGPLAELWTCPRCGRQFARINQSHSCGSYSVEAFLERKPPRSVELFRGFVELARSCGPLTLAPASTRIGLQVRTIFAAVNGLSDRGLEAHVVLARRLESPRFSRIETISPTSHVHHFRISKAEQLDQELRSWLCEAYSWGAR